MEVGLFFCMADWKSNGWCWGRQCELLKVYYCYLQMLCSALVSTWSHIYIDLTLVQEMQYLFLMVSKSRIKALPCYVSLCFDHFCVCVFLCFYVWSGVICEKTFLKYQDSAQLCVISLNPYGPIALIIYLFTICLSVYLFIEGRTTERRGKERILSILLKNS